ncbi:hypothetical protein [Sutcliffiella deserti]|uniref:hypothetical protein n=1 Tax=Sutcliffiella deserti TaxID=2875501 RepID=UPI001CBDE442|nr:hypothetical protein [Sutcliffiella deserti]
MEKNEQGLLYINMFIGTLGLILIIVGAIKYYEVVGNSTYFILFSGFILTMIYMNFLEKKAGISNRIIWTRSLLAILTLIIISYFYFDM